MILPSQHPPPLCTGIPFLLRQSRLHFAFPYAGYRVTDWGPDNVWCGAADEYSRVHKLGRPGCAVVPSVTADHHDTRTIKKDAPTTDVFWWCPYCNFDHAGWTLHGLYRHAFPDWWGAGDEFFSPFNNFVLVSKTKDEGYWSFFN